MHIYIDESGIFVAPSNGEHKISCVAALIIPSSRREEAFREFERLRDSWIQDSTEIKGSKLSESQVADVVSLLSNYDVLVEVCATVMGLCTDQEITAYKSRQAEKITENLTSDHHPNLVKQMNDYKALLPVISNQEFIQSTLTVSLIEQIIRVAPLYYCQRIPKELGEFYWCVDAKQNKITASEDYWNTFMLPIIERRSIKKPFAQIIGGDYSYFEKFYSSLNIAPTHIRNDLRDSEAPFQAINIKKMMRDSFTFGNSKQDTGLQLVDIIANASRRAFNGHLKKEGWESLGSLFVKRKPQTINLVYLSTDRDKAKRIPINKDHQFAIVMWEIELKAKSMFLTHPGQAPWI
jgi:hypothetical protein